MENQKIGREKLENKIFFVNVSLEDRMYGFMNMYIASVVKQQLSEFLKLNT